MGADADRGISPWNLAGLSVRELAHRVWNEMWVDDVIDRAAALSYYFLFSLFPALLFMTALIGMLPLPTLMGSLLDYADQVLPPDAASLVRKTLSEVVAGSRPSLLSLGAVATLWFASNGIGSIINALNIVYGVEDPRPWWKRRLLAVVLTLAMAFFVLTAGIVLVFGGAIGQMLWSVVGLGDLAVKIWAVAHGPVALAGVVAGVAILYYLAPAVEHRRWYWVTPGSLFAVTTWVLMSIAFRFYVAHFSDYNATYGSIGGVMLLMLWFYLSGLVLLVGAEINSEIEHAAAVRGATTAKARGERTPGDASTARSEPPGEALGRPADAAQERAVATVARQAHPGGDGPDPIRPALPGTPGHLVSLRPAPRNIAARTTRGLRVVPWLATWAAMRLVARTARSIARPRHDEERPRRAA